MRGDRSGRFWAELEALQATVLQEISRLLQRQFILTNGVHTFTD